MNDKYAIKYNDEVIGYLNQDLIEKQKVNDDNLERIKYLHVGKHNIFEQMKSTDDKYLLRMFAEMITLIEYELQHSWGFPMNKNYHRFWLIPKCSCPSMDNEDRYGTAYSIKAPDCLIHGWEMQ